MLLGISLVVQWLNCVLPVRGGVDLTPGQGTKIPQAVQNSQKKKKKRKKTSNSNNNKKTPQSHKNIF